MNKLRCVHTEKLPHKTKLVVETFDGKEYVASIRSRSFSGSSGRYYPTIQQALDDGRNYAKQRDLL